MDPNLITSVNQLIDKQDTTIAMLQAVVRAIYDNAGISGQAAGTSGGFSATTTNISIPIPLPVVLSGGTFDVNVNNQPIAVNASQSGAWNVGITGQPIQVSISQPTYKYAVISANTSGDTTVVAAVTGKRIRAVAFALVAAGTVNVKFKRGSTDITGTMRLVEAGGIAHAFEGGLFQTNVGEALNINLSANVQVGGYLVYEEI